MTPTTVAVIHAYHRERAAAATRARFRPGFTKLCNGKVRRFRRLPQLALMQNDDGEWLMSLGGDYNIPPTDAEVELYLRWQEALNANI